MPHGPLYHHMNALDVRVGASLRLVVGVTDVVPDQPLFFAIEATLCHGSSDSNIEGGNQVVFTRELGQSGEEMAAQFLTARGFKVLARNYRLRSGEIDLIVTQGERLLFVEVKARRSFEEVSPLELIPRKKQIHLSKAAQHYLAKNRLWDRAASFALVVVDITNGQCELVEDIFTTQWGY